MWWAGILSTRTSNTPSPESFFRDNSNERWPLWLLYSLKLEQMSQPFIRFTHPIRAIGMSKIPALMKKVVPAANFPLSSFIVQVYSGLKINWLQKLHKLSADAKIEKRAPKRKIKLPVKQCQKNLVHTNNKMYWFTVECQTLTLGVRGWYLGVTTLGEPSSGTFNLQCIGKKPKY